MRTALIGSVIFHIVVFGLVIFNFTGSQNKEAAPPVPVSVEILSPKDYSERKAGKADGKVDAAPVQLAEAKAAEERASARKEAEPKPVQKPADKEALLPPPKTAEPQEVKPAELVRVEPPPQKPAEKPAAKPQVKKEAPPKPAPKPKIAETRKNEEPEVKKAEAKPSADRTFDPNRIASILQKDGSQRPNMPPSAMDAPPSKSYSDRQTAVLNRDANAGAPSGDYDRNKPWRPASSLQDQAMGLTQATGRENAGSCADLVQSRIEQNWDLPIGALSAETTIVRLHIELNRDGTLARAPAVMESSMSPSYQAMADAAIRAALKAQPYPVPPEQYERCRDMVLRFNPRDMYGG